LLLLLQPGATAANCPAESLHITLSFFRPPGIDNQCDKVKISMQIPVKFSLEEIQALLEMVENQLFRMKFIDSKIPGHKPDPAKQRVSNSAVNTLQEAYKKAKGFKSKDAA